jgi:hypothetical protein
VGWWPLLPPPPPPLPPSPAADLPDASKREWIAEPYVRLEMVTPKDYVGPLMDLATTRRGAWGHPSSTSPPLPARCRISTFAPGIAQATEGAAARPSLPLPLHATPAGRGVVQ